MLNQKGDRSSTKGASIAIKLFADNFKNFSCEFMITNEEAPLSIKQRKKDSREIYPQAFKVKCATKFSNLESNDIETDATGTVKSQSFVDSALFVKDGSTPLLNLVMGDVMSLRNMVVLMRSII
jgi:hypothetical protein